MQWKRFCWIDKLNIINLTNKKFSGPINFLLDIIYCGVLILEISYEMLVRNLVYGVENSKVEITKVIWNTFFWREVANYNGIEKSLEI